MQFQCKACNRIFSVSVAAGSRLPRQIRCRCGAIVTESAEVSPTHEEPQSGLSLNTTSHSEAPSPSSSSVTYSFGALPKTEQGSRAEQPLSPPPAGEGPVISSAERPSKSYTPELRLVRSEPASQPVAQHAPATPAVTEEKQAAVSSTLAFRLADSQSVPQPDNAPALQFTPSSEEQGSTAGTTVAASAGVSSTSQKIQTQGSSPATLSPAAGSPQPRQGKRRPGAWRQCIEHPNVKSDTMCPTCAVGYCAECKKSICPVCDGPCIEAAGYTKWLEQERLRARPMLEEIKTILLYPLQDPVAFCIFAIVTGFFAFAAMVSPRAIIFSWGILLWYSFHTLYQVASGNLTRFIPEFNDISDLTHPLRLSGAALTITWGPMILIGVLFATNIGIGFPSLMGETPVEEESVVSPPEEDPTMAEVQSLLGETGDEETTGDEVREETEPKRGVSSSQPEPVAPAASATSTGVVSGASLLLLVALLWKVAYTPVALIVAALSKNVWSVLNPLIGIDTIRRMGPVYWHVMIIYTGLTVAELVVGKILGMIPIAGMIGMAFVKAYIAIATGCALGLGVFKKAPELGWD